MPTYWALLRVGRLRAPAGGGRLGGRWTPRPRPLAAPASLPRKDRLLSSGFSELKQTPWFCLCHVGTPQNGPSSPKEGPWPRSAAPSPGSIRVRACCWLAVGLATRTAGCGSLAPLGTIRTPRGVSRGGSPPEHSPPPLQPQLPHPAGHPTEWEKARVPIGESYPRKGPPV